MSHPRRLFFNEFVVEELSAMSSAIVAGFSSLVMMMMRSGRAKAFSLRIWLDGRLLEVVDDVV